MESKLFISGNESSTKQRKEGKGCKKVVKHVINTLKMIKIHQRIFLKIFLLFFIKMVALKVQEFSFSTSYNSMTVIGYLACNSLTIEKTKQTCEPFTNDVTL